MLQVEVLSACAVADVDVRERTFLPCASFVAGLWDLSERQGWGGRRRERMKSRDKFSEKKKLQSLASDLSSFCVVRGQICAIVLVGTKWRGEAGAEHLKGSSFFFF